MLWAMPARYDAINALLAGTRRHPTATFELADGLAAPGAPA